METLASKNRSSISQHTTHNGSSSSPRPIASSLWYSWSINLCRSIGSIILRRIFFSTCFKRQEPTNMLRGDNTISSLMRWMNGIWSKVSLSMDNTSLFADSHRVFLHCGLVSSKVQKKADTNRITSGTESWKRNHGGGKKQGTKTPVNEKWNRWHAPWWKSMISKNLNKDKWVPTSNEWTVEDIGIILTVFLGFSVIGYSVYGMIPEKIGWKEVSFLSKNILVCIRL